MPMTTLHRRAWRRKPPLGVPINGAHPLAQGLEACWIMNEGQGQWLYDLTGHQHDILLGQAFDDFDTSTRWVAGHLGGPALESLNAFDVLANGNLKVALPFTAEMPWSAEVWIRKLPGNSPACILDEDTTTGIFTTEDATNFRINYTADTVVTQSRPLLFEQWYHCVLTQSAPDNGQATVAIYIDGALDTSAVITPTTNHWNQCLNNEVSDTLSAYLGLMRVWGRTLTPPEIRELAQQPFGMFARQAIPQPTVSSGAAQSLQLLVLQTADVRPVRRIPRTTALEFGATDDALICATGRLPSVQAATVMGLVQLTTDRSATQTFWQYGNTTADKNWQVVVTGGGHSLGWWDGTTFTDTGVGLRVGEWYHLAMVMFGNPGVAGSEFWLYLNGQQVGYASPTGTTESDDGDAILHLGTDPVNVDEWLAGCISCVKVYGRALSQGDIQAEMRQYVPTRRVDLALWAPLRHPLDLNDYSGQGNHFISTGALDLAAGPPLPWAVARFRYAFVPRELPVESPTITLQPSRLQWQVHALAGPGALPPAGMIVWRPRRLMQARQRHIPAQSLQRQDASTRGLLAWYLTQPWMLTGPTLYNLAGHEHGNLIGASGLTDTSGYGPTDRPGGRGEIRLDGNDDYVSISGIIGTAVTGLVITVAVWMYPRAFGLSKTICDTNTTGPTRQLSFFLETGVDGWIACGGTVGRNIPFDPPWTVGAWQHLVLVFDGTSVTTYRNGVRNGQVTGGGLYGSGMTDAEWRFGQNPTGGGSSFLGMMDDIRVYNRALSMGEVVELYETSLTGSLHQLQQPRRLWTVGNQKYLTIQPTRFVWQAQHPRLTAPQPPPILWTPKQLPQSRTRYVPGQSVNRQSSLALDLRAWWLAHPWQFQGHTWLEMVSAQSSIFLGTFANEGPFGWSTQRRPGGTGAMSFDGSSGRVAVAPATAYNNLGQLTLSGWINPRSFGSVNKARIIDKLGIAGWAGFAFGLLNTDGCTRALTFDVGGLSPLSVVSQHNVIDLQVWTHIAVVWNGGFQKNDVTFYVNGQIIPINDTASISGTAPINDDTYTGLYLGNRDNSDRGFDGYLDDLRLYARALTADTVEALYHDSLTGSRRLLRPPRQTLTIGRVQTVNFLIAITPARMQWAAQDLRSSKPFLLAPAQMSWRSHAPILSQTVSTIPRGRVIIPHVRHWTHKPPLGVQLQRNHPLAQGLEACWLMNEGQGNRLYDLSGNGHTIFLGQEAGEDTYCRWGAGGAYGGPVLESLADAGTTAPSTGNIRPQIPFFDSGIGWQLWSMDCYLSKQQGDTYGTLIASESPAPLSGGLSGLFTHETGGGYKIDYVDSGGVDRQNNTILQFNVWYHIAVVIRRAGPISVANLHQILFYVNGLFDGTDFANQTKDRWRCFLNGPLSETFKGSINWLRVWNRSFAADAIHQLALTPFAMFSTKRYFALIPQPPITPSRMQWRAQALIRNFNLRIEPAQVKWQASRLENERLIVPTTPPQVQWQAQELSATTEYAIQPVQMKWKANRQDTPIGIVLRDCGPEYEEALQQPFIAGDWLIQAPAIGLQLSMRYELGGGWEHRIVDISDIEISVPPGGGLASVANVTVSVAEDGEGQSIIQLWESASAIGAVAVTVDFLLDGASQALRIFTGHIDNIVSKDAVSQMLLVDDSIRKNLILPSELITTGNFPNADQAVITRPLPFVYGLGERLGAVPLLLVDVTANSYIVAAHPMHLGGKLAVFDGPTNTFLTLDSIVFIPNNGAAQITVGTLDISRFSYAVGVGTVFNAANITDGNSQSLARIGTDLGGVIAEWSATPTSGTGFIDTRMDVPGYPYATTVQLVIANHRRSPGSDPTVTGTFWLRTITISGGVSAHSRILWQSPSFNHVTSAQRNEFIISNVQVGMHEYLTVLVKAENAGVVGNPSATYEVGEISLTPLVAVSGNISGAVTAVGLPINMQELRFNPVRAVLSVYAATGVTNATNAIDGLSTTKALIGTGNTDSNLDGIGELILTTTPTSAMRANNTVVIDLANHRRSLTSTPTVTGTFSIQTYNTATGVLLRDNLFTTEAFRHTTNPLTTSYTATAINLGIATQLAVRLLARNEGGPGSAGQTYEVGEVAIDTFYQPRGESSDVYLYGTGYSGRYDQDGSVTAYADLGVGTLLTQPDMIIASFFIEELGITIDVESFANTYSFFGFYSLVFDGGIGGGWAVEQSEVRTLLDELARQSTSLLFPSFGGTWGIRPYRSDAPVHQTFTVDNILTVDGSERQRPEDRLSTMQITLGNLQDVYNRFEVRYKYNVATRKYDRVWTVDKNGSNLPDDALDKAAIEATCATSFLRYGDLEPLILNAYWIADDDTAAYLLRHVALYFSQQRITLQFETTFQAGCLQVGDFITVTYPGIPDGDNGQNFEVHTIRYMPIKGRVQLTCSRVSTIPDVPPPPPPAAPTGCARFAADSDMYQGMRACFDLDENNGNRVDHVTGLELTPFGNVVGTIGKVGNAAAFQRANGEYLYNQSALVGGFLGEWTLAFWIRLLSVPADTWGIVTNGVGTSAGTFEVMVLVLGGGSRIWAAAHGDPGAAVISASGLPFTGSFNDWTLVTLWKTRDGGGAGSINVQLNQGGIVTTTFPTSAMVAYDRFCLGAIGGTGSTATGYADVYLDQVMLWSRILTAEERAIVWNNGTG